MKNDSVELDITPVVFSCYVIVHLMITDVSDASISVAILKLFSGL